MTYDPYALTTWSVLLAPPPPPVLTLPQAKLAAGLDWPSGDPRDDQMTGFIAAATSRVERDTELALLTQSRRVFVRGALPPVIVLPTLCRPLQAVTAITYVDPDGVSAVVNPALYTIESYHGLVQLVATAAWPSADLTVPWQIDIVAGYVDAASLPPLLYHLVGLLTAHLATIGRDLTQIGHIIADTPQGYEDLIATFRPVLA